MLSISSCQKTGMTNDEVIEFLKEKELATEEELTNMGFRQPNLADDYFTPKGGAMQVWHLPLVKATYIVRTEMMGGKLLIC